MSSIRVQRVTKTGPSGETEWAVLKWLDSDLSGHGRGATSSPTAVQNVEEERCLVDLTYVLAYAPGTGRGTVQQALSVRLTAATSMAELG